MNHRTNCPRPSFEVALRVQRLSEAPDPELVFGALPGTKPLFGEGTLTRTTTTIEQVHSASRMRWAVEATYEGSIRFTESQMEDPSEIDPEIAQLTRWISSTLISLADLPFSFLMPDEDDE